MINQLKSELRKLFTVRSTYILLIIAFALAALFAYLGTSPESYEVATCNSTNEVIYSKDFSHAELEQKSPEEICDGSVEYKFIVSKELPKERLLYALQESIPIMVTFLTIIMILFVVHEFRYNIINYTLTISNSRSKVLLSKLSVGVMFTLVITLITVGVTFASVYMAANLKDLTIPAQNYDWLYIIGRHVVYALGYSLFFMGIALLIRNLTASIAIAFILPTIDGIGGFLLSTRDIEPTKVLPFSALDRFGNVAGDISSQTADIGERFITGNPQMQATALGAFVVFAAYLIATWILAWVMFLRRDAN